ncbi:MAG TPA: dihydrofolate reductase [Mycobacterium sp.]|jgi:dihydrofolate reductase
MKSSVSLIWAQSISGVIGRSGDIPWRLPEDMSRFKDLTMGHTVVMGRRTWESLPDRFRPLPGRRNVVLTRQTDYAAEGAEVVTSFQDALALDDALRPRGSSEDDVWVIGGAEIYALGLPHAARCEVTEVDIHMPRQDDDAVAPVLDESWVAHDGEWQVSRTGLRYRFSSYRRR